MRKTRSDFTTDFLQKAALSLIQTVLRTAGSDLDKILKVVLITHLYIVVPVTNQSTVQHISYKYS